MADHRHGGDPHAPLPHAAVTQPQEPVLPAAVAQPQEPVPHAAVAQPHAPHHTQQPVPPPQVPHPIVQPPQTPTLLNQLQPIGQQHHTQTHKLLGSGSYGKVFRYRDPNNNNQFVALKLFGDVRELRHEMIIAKELQPVQFPTPSPTADEAHRVVPFLKRLDMQFHDPFTQGRIITAFGLRYQFFPLGSVDDFISHHSPLITELALLVWTHNVAQGLEYLCQKKIIHHDIKPANLLVRDDHSLMITDLGMAYRLPPHQQNHTPTHLAGTLLYAPPGVINKQPNDFQVDIFSLGVSIYELACGTAPTIDEWADSFLDLPGHGQDIIQKAIVARVRSPNWPPPVPGQFSPQFNNLLKHMMRPHPTARPTANELLFFPLLLQAIAHSPLPLQLSIPGSEARFARAALTEVPVIRDELNRARADFQQTSARLADQTRIAAVLGNDLSALQKREKDTEAKHKQELYALAASKKAVEDELLACKQEFQAAHDKAIALERVHTGTEQEIQNQLEAALKHQAENAQSCLALVAAKEDEVKARKDLEAQQATLRQELLIEQAIRATAEFNRDGRIQELAQEQAVRASLEIQLGEMKVRMAALEAEHAKLKRKKEAGDITACSKRPRRSESSEEEAEREDETVTALELPLSQTSLQDPAENEMVYFDDSLKL